MQPPIVRMAPSTVQGLPRARGQARGSVWNRRKGPTGSLESWGTWEAEFCLTARECAPSIHTPRYRLKRTEDICPQLVQGHSEQHYSQEAKM